MTIKLKNEVFNNLEFIETVKKIYRSELSAKQAYTLFKTLKKLNEYAREYNEVRDKLLLQYASLNDDSWTFESGDKMNSFEKEFNDLLEIEFDLGCDKIQYPIDLNISPYEMELMECLFDYKHLEDDVN